MNDINENKANIYFRFLSLDKFQAYSIVHEISGSSHEFDNATKQYIGYVPLTEQNFEEINDYFVRQRIMIEACDILVSINSIVSKAVIDIPTIVNRMLKYIDCKLTFTYTSE